MNTRILWPLVSLLALGCAQPFPLRESPQHAARMHESGNRYLACLEAEAESGMKNTAGAEDIAAAAHGRCWDAWESYRTAARANFSFGARTPDEIQFAADRAEAHLRQFESEARRDVIETVIERNLKASR